MNVIDRLRVVLEKRRQQRRIARYGWTGVYVGDERSVSVWAYTIGFDETLDHPEIIVFDLPQASANSLLWQAFNELRDGVLKVEDGLAWSAIATPCAWRKVHPEQVNEWLSLARIRRFDRTGKTDGLEAFQLVLPDPDGNLPWEAGYDERLRPLQPALYEPPADAGERS